LLNGYFKTSEPFIFAISKENRCDKQYDVLLHIYIAFSKTFNDFLYQA